jgi:coenzyme F420-reducing hydrogenase gamma subunit
MPIPTISVHSLTGCAGELLVILENLDKILPHARVVSFPFAQSNNKIEDEDIAFVEGSVSQPHDLEKLREIRDNCRHLVAVGTCAVWGCVQRGCASKTAREMAKAVYGENTKIEYLEPQPIDKYVQVDVKLSGCPIDASQFMAVTASLLKDHLPYVTHKPVCLECKLKENACVLIEDNLACLGPVTAAGCGALCPSVGAACYGCFGPCDMPQMAAMAQILCEKGFSLDEVITRLLSFGAPKELFGRMKIA